MDPIQTTADPVDPQEAIDFFRRKTLLTDGEFKALSEQNYRKAFTLAGVADIDVIQSVYDSLDGALAEGTLFKDWKAEIGEKLEAAWGGTVANPGFRLETIFRTNLQSSYAAGRYEQAKSGKEDRPYLMLLDVPDKDQCFAAGTLVLLADGKSVPIEQVRPGDSVVSCKGRARAVVAALVTPQRAWGTLSFDNGVHLRVTPNHPILTTGGWVRAGQLKIGSKVVLSPERTEDLQGLWEDVSTSACKTIVLRRQVPPLCHPMESLQDLWQSLQTQRKSWASGLLLSGVQGEINGSAPAPVLTLQKNIHPDTRTKALLLRSLRDVHPEVSALPALVHRSSSRSEPRATQTMLGGLPNKSEEQRLPAGATSEDLQKVRQAVSGSLRRQARKGNGRRLLLNELSEESSYQKSMPNVWQVCLSEVERSRGEILHGQLLSKVSGGDYFGEGGSRGARGPGVTLRARSSDTSLERGLSRQRQVDNRSGRNILALVGINSPKGRQKRCETDFVGLRGHSSRRKVRIEEPRVRPGSLSELRPIPGDNIASLSVSAVVISVDWELTQLPQAAYDLKIDEDSGFVANGVVVHNCDDCAAISDAIGNKAIPFDEWDDEMPPYHCNCRDTVITLSEEEAIAQGVLDEMPDLDEHIDDGFMGPPDSYEPDPDEYSDDLQGDVERFVE